MRKLKGLLTAQFRTFIIGGVLCAAIDIGLMQLLIHYNIGSVTAASAGFGAGLLVNYLFHAKITFQSATGGANFAKFMCVVAINYLITIAFVWLGVTLFDQPLLGKLASLPVVAVNGFLLSKYWIFK